MCNYFNFIITPIFLIQVEFIHILENMKILQNNLIKHLYIYKNAFNQINITLQFLMKKLPIKIKDLKTFLRLNEQNFYHFS